MPWFSEPNKPEESPVENTDTEESVQLTDEGRRKSWRLLMLMDALIDRRPDEPISLEEIALLGRVADGNFDLHDACAALRNGCGVDHLAVIFT